MVTSLSRIAKKKNKDKFCLDKKKKISFKFTFSLYTTVIGGGYRAPQTGPLEGTHPVPQLFLKNVGS